MQVVLTEALAGSHTLSGSLACTAVCWIIINTVSEAPLQHIANVRRLI